MEFLGHPFKIAVFILHSQKQWLFLRLIVATRRGLISQYGLIFFFWYSKKDLYAFQSYQSHSG